MILLLGTGKANRRRHRKSNQNLGKVKGNTPCGM